MVASGKGVGAYLSLSGSGRWGGGWRLFEAGRQLIFSAFRMGRLFEVGANSRMGACSNKYGTQQFINHSTLVH